jgi:hypothetical protein
MPKLLHRRNRQDGSVYNIDTIRYTPRSLPRHELGAIKYVLQNENAAKMICILLHRSLNIDEIQEAIGISKTSVIPLLKAMDKNQMIKSEWKTYEYEGGQKTRVVRTFTLNKDKLGLVQYYEPFLISYG